MKRDSVLWRDLSQRECVGPSVHVNKYVLCRSAHKDKHEGGEKEEKRESERERNRKEEGKKGGAEAYRSPRVLFVQERVTAQLNAHVVDAPCEQVSDPL